MAIPDFQTLMRPLLEEYAEGGERRIADVRAVLATRFELTDEDRAERLPSGAARTLVNRVGWATTYLYRVGLLARPKRATYQITQRGRDVLAANPERVDLGVLSQFPEFAEFRQTQALSGAGGAADTATVVVEAPETKTPNERIEAAHKELRLALLAEVRDQLSAMPWAAFEGLVLDVLRAMGYGDGTDDAGLLTSGGADAGIDGVVREDHLGLDSVYVQAKRWEATVGRPVVQAFVGALQGARAAKGVIFTASTFSREAREYAAGVSPRVVLVDGERLAALMIDHNVGVSDGETYVVKRVDSAYFGDDE